MAASSQTGQVSFTRRLQITLTLKFPLKSDLHLPNDKQLLGQV